MTAETAIALFEAANQAASVMPQGEVSVHADSGVMVQIRTYPHSPIDRGGTIWATTELYAHSLD